MTQQHYICAMQHQNFSKNNFFDSIIASTIYHLIYEQT